MRIKVKAIEKGQSKKKKKIIEGGGKTRVVIISSSHTATVYKHLNANEYKA